MIFLLIMILFLKDGSMNPTVTTYDTEEKCLQTAHQVLEIANNDKGVTDVLWSCQPSPVQPNKDAI